MGLIHDSTNTVVLPFSATASPTAPEQLMEILCLVGMRHSRPKQHALLSATANWHEQLHHCRSCRLNNDSRPLFLFETLGMAVFVELLAAFLGAWGPARWASRQSIAEDLRYEMNRMVVELTIQLSA